MRGNGKRVVGTLIVRGALHQISEEDEEAGKWVTRTYSATFALEDRDFVGLPGVGEKVNIGPEEAPLDYWAIVTEADQAEDGSIKVTAQLDVNAQKESVAINEVSDEYEVLTFYGHADQIDEELIVEKRIPMNEVES